MQKPTELQLCSWGGLRGRGERLPPALLKVIYGSNVRVCLKFAAEFILSATYSTIIGHRKSAEERVINGCDLWGSKNTGRMREN